MKTLEQIKRLLRGGVLPVVAACLGLVLAICLLGFSGMALWNNEPVKLPKLLAIAVGWGLLILASLIGGRVALRLVSEDRSANRASRSESILIGVIMLIAVFFGSAFLMMALTICSPLGFNAACVGLLVGLAALAVGVFLGFLFGIPRLVSGEGTSFDENWSLKPAAAGQGDRTRYQTNTNLTQISDWLTKTMVGVGLVQVRPILERFRLVSEALGAGLGWPATANPPPVVASAGAHAAMEGTVIGGAILVFYSTVGFLGGYMLTRLFLAGAFMRADTGGELVSGNRETLRKFTLGEWEYGGPQPGYILTLAGDIVKVPLASLGTWEEKSTWAKAQLTLGNVDAAIAVYEELLREEQRNASLWFDYAVAISKKESFGPAFAEALKTAHDCLRANDNVELRKNIFKALTYTMLFQPMPGGFEQALRYGHEYVDDPRHLPSGGIYVNLVCAYGQWAEWLVRREQPQWDEDFLKTLWTRDGWVDSAFVEIRVESWRGETFTLLQIRDVALRWIRRAILLDPAWTNKFQSLLGEPGSGLTSNSDDDLTIFRYDPKIRAAVGLTA